MRAEADLKALHLAERFKRTRARTDALFALIDRRGETLRPIPLRHPAIFYFGHLDAFTVNTLFVQALGQRGQAADLDTLFARGIDPLDAAAAEAAGRPTWPSHEAVADYREAVQRRLMAYMRSPGPKPWHVLEILLEHELMHQETLLYLIHQLPPELKHAPSPRLQALSGPSRPNRPVAIPAGPTWLGSPPGWHGFAWDNELPGHAVDVPAFQIDAMPVTNGHYLAYMRATGAARPFFWTEQEEFRGLFGPEPLHPAAPVLVTHDEAAAYAAWIGGSLPTEAQWQRAAYGDDPRRPYPWGEAVPGPQHGNFGFERFGPTPVGAFPAGDSPFGVADLLGNGWEWTATPFGPFAGFQPDPHYPGYSADFFDGRHFVLKGGSWATDAALLRRGFRNWFYADYPYAYATFRVVRG